MVGLGAVPAPQPCLLSCPGESGECPASHMWDTDLALHLHGAAQTRGRHGPVQAAEQSWDTAAPDSPTDTLGTIPGLVALGQPTASLACWDHCSLHVASQVRDLRDALPWLLGVQQMLLQQGLHRDERTRSQQPSCLPPGANPIPLPQALPNRPLSQTSCPCIPSLSAAGAQGDWGSRALLGTHNAVTHLSTGPEG